MSLTCNSVQYFQPMNTLANFSSSSQPASPDHPPVSPFLDPVHITPHVLQPSHIHTGPGLWNDLPPEFRPFPLPSPSLPITSYHLLYIHVISITIGLSTRNQSAIFSRTHTLGAVHKVRHARGGQGVREGVTFCDGGRGKEDDVTLINIFYHTYGTWNLKWCLTFCCNRCILTEGERTQTTADKTFQTKDPLTKPLGQKPPRTIEREFVQGAFVRFLCTRRTKNRGGGPRCVTYFWNVWQSVTEGRGSKLAKK